MAKNKVPFSRNKHKTDIVAYLTLVGWLIAYVFGDRTASKFHLNQALTVMLADLGLNAVFAFSTLNDMGPVSAVIRAVCSLLSFCMVVCWVMGLVRACKDSEQPVPVVGDVHLLK